MGRLAGQDEVARPRHAVAVGPASKMGRSAGQDAVAPDRRDPVRGMARGGGLNVAGAIVSQASFFLITLLIARHLGRTAVGLYSQGFAFLAILELISLSGFRAGLTRFVAVHRVDKDQGALRGTLRIGLGASILGAVAFGVALYLVAPLLAVHVFRTALLTAPLRFVSVVLLFQTLTDAALAATQGWMTMRPYCLIGMMYEPVTRLALTVGGLAIGLGLKGALWALVVSNSTAAVFSLIALRRLTGRIRERASYRTRQIFSFSMVSWLASFASTGLIWADTILLGIYESSRAVGVYQVATRVVLLASFSMAPINAAFSPRIAKLYHGGDTEGLRRAYVAATGWILRLSLPALVVCVVLPHQLLHLFGRSFEAGAAVTIILAVGELMDSATGPCGLMLNMSGRPVYSLIDNVIVLGLNVGLNIVLIPRYGIIGAAWAWAIALWVVNILRVWQVQRALHMVPFEVSELKALAAVAIAGGIGVVVREVTGGMAALEALIVGGVVMVAIYLGVVVLLGMSPDDRVMLGLAQGRHRNAGRGQGAQR